MIQDIMIRQRLNLPSKFLMAVGFITLALSASPQALAQTCASASDEGSFNYNSTSEVFQYCGDSALGWQDFSGGAFENASGVVRSTGTLASDDFVFGSTQLADTANTDHDSRMFYDKSLSAFRVGYADGTQWDTVGDFSIGIGRNTTANGYAGIAIGNTVTASGSSSLAMGSNTTSSNIVSIGIGNAVTSSGFASLAMGSNTTASGLATTAMGNEVKATGTQYTFAIGLADQTNTDGNRPQVSGEGSMGIFMDQADNYVLSDTDVLGIVGGALVIDKNISNSGGTVSALIALHTEGNVSVNGSATSCTIGNGTGATSCTSDERLKENIEVIDGALDKVSQLRGVTYTLKDKTKDQSQKVGVIAQDVEKAFPQVVDEIDGMKSVDYAALVAPLIEAVKELKAQNEELRKELEELKTTVNNGN